MSHITFPNGHVVDVVFDDIAHTYVVAHRLHDGTFSDYRPTHGATTPLAVVPKPFLTPWGSKLGVESTLQYLADNPGLVEALPQFFQDLEDYNNKTRSELNKPVMSYYRFKKLYPWYSELKSSYKKKAKEGQELGTWLHLSIEDFYRSGRKNLPIVTPAVEGMWHSFTQFDNFFKPRPDEDGLEFLVYSILYGYSGQGDFRGTMNGKWCIGDWKSTNRSDMNADGISAEYFFQVGGLAQAEFERTGKWVEDLFIANFDKKGEEPRVIWASEFGMAPQDAAKAYISCFNNYHMIEHWERKWHKR